MLFVRKIFFAQHMVTTQFEMRATQSEHHRIRQQDSRHIEFTGTLLIIHISRKHRLQCLISVLMVRFQDRI